MTDLDIRSVPEDDRREATFETLADAESGQEVTLVTDRDVDVLLHHYQIKRDHRLRWESERRDEDEDEVRVTKGDAFAADELPEFDVRDMPPQRRHEVLTDTFDRLDPGEGFVLVNDHDPKPLYHELRSTRGETFEWDYTERDSGEWRVDILKTDVAEATADDVAASFDVREIPKRERHPTIHHRYGNIADGQCMEITAPHEPRPLRREFRQRYGDSFAWDIVENEPGRCRVRITKTVDSENRSTDVHGDPADEVSLEATRELDVRDLPPAQRHEQIFEAYDSLRTGEGFVLINDHDPKPLYHQFDAEAGDEFHWAYRQRDAGEFRVLIGKSEATATGVSETGGPDAPF